MTEPTSIENAPRQVTQPLPPPPPVALLPAVLVLCTPEILAAGLCGAAAICTYIKGGKPITMACPEFGSKIPICASVLIGGVVRKFCVLLTASLTEALTAIDAYIEDLMGWAYETMQKMAQLCWLEFPPVLGPIGQILSSSQEFKDCLQAAVDWLRDMVATIAGIAKTLRGKVSSRDGFGNRGPLPAGVPRW